MIADASKRKTIVVGVGDCRVAGPPTTSLATYALGSCIAVLAWDWKLKLGGLLHVMLPDSGIDVSQRGNGSQRGDASQRAGRAQTVANPWTYVDTAMPALLRELIARGSRINQLRWCIAGGAGMMVDSARFEIGRRNHIAIRKVFLQLGVFIEREDVGQSESRSVRLDLETGRITLRKGGSPEQTLVHALSRLP